MDVPGAPVSNDKFTPRALEVDVPDNLASVFANARRIASGEDPQFPFGEKRVAILTPGRLIMPVPAPFKDTVGPELLAGVKKWLGPESRDIAVVSYTKLEALMDEDQRKFKCIPFLVRLGILAAAGHHVVVFEGHPSALELGLRDCDVLLVDSGMLPFIQQDWPLIAIRAMRSGSAFFICSREKQNVLEVVPASQPPGFLYRETDGQVSYANCLLTILGKRSGVSATLASGTRVPDLRTLAEDPEDVEWTARALPFRYEELDAGLVIRTILRAAGVERDFRRLIPGLKTQYALDARLAQKGGTSFCSFRLTLSGFGFKKRLEVLREEFCSGTR